MGYKYEKCDNSDDNELLHTNFDPKSVDKFKTRQTIIKKCITLIHFVSQTLTKSHDLDNLS